MRVKVLKDSTLVIKAGQIVELDNRDVARLVKQGRIAIQAEKAEKAEKPAKKAATKKK